MATKRTWNISIKLWLAMTLLILLVLGGLAVAITWLFDDFYLQQKLDSLKIEAIEISNHFAYNDHWSKDSAALNSLKVTSGTQVMLLDKQGNVLAAAEASVPAGLHNGFGVHGPKALGASMKALDFFTEENLNEVLRGRTIALKAGPVGGGTQTMLIAAAPIGEDPVNGVVLLGSSPIHIQESIVTFKRLIIYASLIAIALAALISLLIARQLTRPLALMQKGASRMAREEFEPITGVNSNDEIGELAEALNLMGERLKRQMEWLSQEKNLLQGIVESISDAVIMVSATGQIMYINEPAKALWQENENEHEHQGRKQVILQFITEMIDQRESLKTLTLGTQILQIGIASMSEREGIKGYVAVLSDVTASLRAEKERRDFLASVTHELRTPLHLIQGYLEAIQDGVIPQPEQALYIDLVLEEAQRLARLVHELQDTSRVELSQKPNLKAIACHDFLQELKQRFIGKALELGITLEISDCQGEIVADRDRLLQVFINLLDNAFRYTPPGNLIRVWLEDNDNFIRFIVKDEGEGIPPEDLPHIFDHFYRVDKARTRKEGGMGLGLAIVKQIVEAHGGIIKAESKLGIGTTFYIDLPKQYLQ